jgi:hypothetical protein
MLWQEQRGSGRGWKVKESPFFATFRDWHVPCIVWLMTPRGGTDFREDEMVDMSKLGQTILAMIGATIMTVTAVGAAVGPARAIETAPISLVAASVSGQAQA